MRQDELDSAIAGYSRAEPRAGLEVRVVARVRLAQQKERWRLVAAVLAFGSLAAGLSVLLVPAPMPPPLVAPTFAMNAFVGAPSAPAPLPVPVPVPVKVSRRKPSRPNQFPTPAPLTPAERALLQFAAAAPESAQSAFGESPELTIEEIVIKPLETEGLP